MKKSILIVDDDMGLLKAISIILDNGDYNIETLMTGKTLINKLEHKPDLILLDKQLSGMDGADICKHLKKKEDTKDISIILISAISDLKKIAENAGADDNSQGTATSNINSLITMTPECLIELSSSSFLRHLGWPRCCSFSPINAFQFVHERISLTGISDILSL